MEKEQNRTRLEIGPGGGNAPFGAGFDPAADGAGQSATVSHGPYAEGLPVAGLSVAVIRARYADRFDIAPHAEAILDGNVVDGETVVGPGQALSFIHRAGEKGRV